MPEVSTLALFIVAAVTLAVVPGPAVLYIVAQSVHGGRLAGTVSALGIATGGLVHVVAAAVGLSAVLVSSAEAYTAVKYAGAAYLVFLGVRRLLSRDDGRAVEAERKPLSTLYLHGIVVNVLNPKTAIFFFAFLPQFADVGRGSVGLLLALLGLVFVGIAAVSDTGYALAAGTIARRVWRTARMQRWVTGGVFVSLGAATALSGGRKS